VKRKTVTVTPAAIQAAARKNTKASARLEGREVPADFVRSPAVERYIAESGRRTADALVPGGAPDRADMKTGISHSGPSDKADDLLSLLKAEIWPLLDHRSRTRGDVPRPDNRLRRRSTSNLRRQPAQRDRRKEI